MSGQRYAMSNTGHWLVVCLLTAISVLGTFADSRFLGATRWTVPQQVGQFCGRFREIPSITTTPSTPTTFNNFTVGTSKDEALNWRIVGGEEGTHISQFPWQVSINSTVAPSLGQSPQTEHSVQFCSGVIVSSMLILTAAHCVQRTTGISLRYASLEYNSGGVVITVAPDQVILNPGFDESTLLHDLALIRLSEPIWIKDSETQVLAPQPICLPQIGLPAAYYSGQVLRTAGWGREELNNRQLPARLRWIDVRIIDNLSCQHTFRDRTNLSLQLDLFGQLCAVGVRDNADICLGDSGAPLFSTFQKFRWSDTAHNYQLGQSRAVLVALASQTYSCGFDNVPSIYISLGPYLAWIWYHIGQTPCS